MAKKLTKKQRQKLLEVLKSFNITTDLGDAIEQLQVYQGYYKKGNKTYEAGPWRNDRAAAEADAFVYALQGYETGVRTRVSKT